MFFPFTALVIAVTGQARERPHRVGVAGTASRAAMIDARSFFIDTRLRVRHIEPRGYPGRCVMAFLAIRSKSPEVKGWIFMAGHTLG